jgi:hypothetical protein
LQFCLMVVVHCSASAVQVLFDVPDHNMLLIVLVS